MTGQTPSQTVGPFFSIGLVPAQGELENAFGPTLFSDLDPKTTIIVGGTLYDGDGTPVLDGLIECWQADHKGHYEPKGGFGRSTTTDGGRFSFQTQKPGLVEGANQTLQAPHLTLVVFARGLLSHAYTRVYFGDERDANAKDAILSNVPEARRQTLIAEPPQTDDRHYRFDIHLQGQRETVFFDV